jgi:hypothetical protein
MCAVHRLKILHGIPIVFDEDDCVGAGERQAKASNVSGEKQTIDTWVRVERLDHSMTLAGVSTTIKPHVRDGGHMFVEEVRLDDIEHLLHLAEDQDAVLRKRAPLLGLSVNEFTFARIDASIRSPPDAAIGQNLSDMKISGSWDSRKHDHTARQGALAHAECRGGHQVDSLPSPMLL